MLALVTLLVACFVAIPLSNFSKNFFLHLLELIILSPNKISHLRL